MSSIDKNRGNFFILLLIVVILYFAHQARPAIEYFTNPFYIQAYERQGGFWSFVSYVYQLTGAGIIVLTIGLPLSIFVGQDIDTNTDFSFGSLLLLLWPILGWYVGHDFNKADSPKLTFMAFSFITLYLVARTVLDLLQSVFGGKSDNKKVSE